MEIPDRRDVARLLAGVVTAASLTGALSAAREPETQFASVEVHTSQEGCAADLDSVPAGKTDASGKVVLATVEPGDHYLHVACPGVQPETYFISPRARDKLEVSHSREAIPAQNSGVAALQPGEVKIQLRQHIQEAIRLRARGHIDEAVEHLRSAYQLDPENSDLHREMGITFLLAKEWKRARVEMLEAIRHDPTDAEAHNGLGYALEKTGNLQGALEEFRTASKLEPNDVSYRRRYISALARLSELQATKKK